MVHSTGYRFRLEGVGADPVGETLALEDAQVELGCGHAVRNRNVRLPSWSVRSLLTHKPCMSQKTTLTLP